MTLLDNKKEFSYWDYTMIKNEKNMPDDKGSHKFYRESNKLF
ncbi:MAG: hypothetical protein AABX46_05125 [Thermoproteota archaeon]